jgi:glycosyltransferase involved in cell wall biosynthesis
MRILFVAMIDSVHTARWITQLTDQGWDIHLFPSTHISNSKLYAKINNIMVYDPVTGLRLGSEHGFLNFSALWQRVSQSRKGSVITDAYLAALIQDIKPDVVHSLEFQHAGYLTLRARKILGDDFPAWLATNWGSDIYLYGRLPDHVERVKEILSICDYYSCECHRDVVLANQMGLRGEVLPVVPNGGGFDLAHNNLLKARGKTSERKLIILKGYQHWAGRALVGVRALELCADALRDYRVAIYSAVPDVKMAAQLFSHKTGISVEFIPPSDHDAMLRWFGQARLYIGLSISDAISTSMLEAMTMGAFPIQSDTACADEWFADGQSGFMVPPEDPATIAEAIRRALTDDILVDRAAEINEQTALNRLDERVIRPQAIAFYTNIYAQGLVRRRLSMASDPVNNTKPLVRSYYHRMRYWNSRLITKIYKRYFPKKYLEQASLNKLK